MRPEYRKLPGKRRGFFNVSSVWAGPDHLLLVRGSRFREEYKRFYFRDVQAIAIARAPRFHISTRAALAAWFALPIVFALLMPALARVVSSSSIRNAWAGLGLAALASIGAWVYISAAQSCRCRIYTAVSADELPSVYRIWTARKFLAEVEPLIAQTQGTIEGEWPAAPEGRTVGPAPVARASFDTTQPAPHLPRRTLASGLFLLSLCADALARLAPLPAALANRVPVALELAAAAGAIAVLVQYNRGRLRAGMHRVAIASLVASGLLYYAQSLSLGISASMTAAKSGKRVTALTFPRLPWAQQAGAGIDAILLVAGLIVSLRRDKERPWN
jgi:hypothetical protein